MGRSYRLMSNKNVCLCTNGLISWKLTAKSLWDKWYSSQNWWHLCNVPCTKSLTQECLVEIQEIEIKINFMRIDKSYKSLHSQYESINYLYAMLLVQKLLLFMEVPLLCHTTSATRILNKLSTSVMIYWYNREGIHQTLELTCYSTSQC